jgi:hypothetical protein
VQQLPFSKYIPCDKHSIKNSTNPQNFVRKDQVREAVVQAMLPPEDSGMVLILN